MHKMRGKGLLILVVKALLTRKEGSFSRPLGLCSSYWEKTRTKKSHFFPPPLMNAYKLLSLFVFFMKIAVVVHGLLYCITAHVTIKEVRYRISY